MGGWYGSGVMAKKKIISIPLPNAKMTFWNRRENIDVIDGIMGSIQTFPAINRVIEKILPKSLMATPTSKGKQKDATSNLDVP